VTIAYSPVFGESLVSAEFAVPGLT